MSNISFSDVCLVVPPFSKENYPPLGLSILKRCLTDNNISCTIDYANIYFSYSLKEKFYSYVTTYTYSSFVGEYVFNDAAGIKNSYSDDEYIREISNNLFSDKQISHLRSVIEEAKKISEVETKKTVDRILKHQPKMVGCSAIFQQRNASLAILKEIKKRDSKIITFMGGYEVFGDAGIEVLKNFDFVDFVYFGESDEIFAEVTQKFLNNNTNVLPYGVLKNGQEYPSNAPHRITRDLDFIPTPDYDDYFDLLNTQEGRALQKDVAFDTLYLEGSRGCSWGQKHPCSFCGENNNHIKYRIKSPERVLQEIEEIETKYNPKRIFFCDNLMPYKWFSEVLPKLSKKQSGTRYFTDVRASLRPKHVKLLKSSGFGALQPGIESLSSHQLSLMNKGVTSIQNISFLKSCKQYRILPLWNYLVGLPGEKPEDYSSPAQIIPLLEHLAPPGGVHDIFFPKYCSYVMHHSKYNIEVRPAAPFKFISPQIKLADYTFINNTAFNFEIVNTKLGEIATGEKDAISVNKNALSKAVNNWIKQFKTYNDLLRLDMYIEDNVGHITDTRSCSNGRKQSVSGEELDIILLCDTPISYEKITDSLSWHDADRLTSILQKLQDKKLIIYRDNLYLSLVVNIEEKFSDKLDFKAFCKSLE